MAIFQYRAIAIVSAVTVVLLLPFLGKSFHMDDTVYLWSAEQVLRDPADFYGFMANWEFTQSYGQIWCLPT